MRNEIRFCLQRRGIEVMSSALSSTFNFDNIFNKRNEDMYGVFRYSHWYSNYLRQGQTRTCMMSSGIFSNIRITFDKGKRGHVWCLDVFSSIFELPSTRRNVDVWHVLGILIIIRIIFDIQKIMSCMMSSGILINKGSEVNDRYDNYPTTLWS